MPITTLVDQLPIGPIPKCYNVQDDLHTQQSGLEL